MKTKTERPILFSAEMVRALLAGRKTQTRRIVKPQPQSDHAMVYADHTDFKCPYGEEGDRLWVKETFTTYRRKTRSEQRKTESILKAFFDGKFKSEAEFVNKALEMPLGSGGLNVLYAADFGEWAYNKDSDLGPWKPSIFMPRKASRLTLEIKTLRVERLQNISEEDAEAEGCCIALVGHDDDFARNCYRKLWESLNSAQSWNDNPWVWVIEFQKLEHHAASRHPSPVTCPT